ncbi:MAG: hypothetical protein V3V08_24100 [Nannocystaceae bacterium]
MGSKISLGRVSLVILIAACSTIAPDPPPPEGCQLDDDCAKGQWCAEQGGVCVDPGDPQRATFALEIMVESEDLRVEVLGCDTVAGKGNVLQLEQPGGKSAITSQFSAAVIPRFGRDKPGATDNCPDGYTPAENGVGYCVGRGSHREASIQYAIPSSVGRGLFDFIGIGVETSESEPLPREFSVATNTAYSAIVSVTPSGVDTKNAYAKVYYALDPHFVLEDPDPAGGPKIDFFSDRRCHWPVSARVRSARGTDGPGDMDYLGGVDVTFSYTTAIAHETSLPWIHNNQSSAISCSETADPSCNTPQTGMTCNLDTETCSLDLHGFVAASDHSSPETDRLGDVDVRIYSYCAPSWVADREFSILAEPRVSSDSSSDFVYPNVYLRASVHADDPGLEVVEPIRLQELCIPRWKAFNADFDFASAPIRLQRGKDTFWCCDTSCFDDDAREARSEERACDTLSKHASISFHTIALPETSDALPPFELEACLKLGKTDKASDIGWYEGKIRDDCGSSPCSVKLGRSDTDVARNYSITIMQPPSSIFRSERLGAPVPVEPGTAIRHPLRPRIVLQGRVSCKNPPEDGSTQDCSAAAQVMAERLRVQEPDTSASRAGQDPLGPYFYTQTTDDQGYFSLPLNPGVYIVTALPRLSAPVGPSRYLIFDLRFEEQGGRIADNGTPAIVDPGDALQLEPGSAVRVRLQGFPDRPTRVSPVDVGNWAAQQMDYWAFDNAYAVDPKVSDLLPADLDLNDPATCHHDNASVPIGCKIRRLQTGTKGLTLTREVEFTTRTTALSPKCPGE